MDLLYSIAPPVETTPAQKPFPQLDIFAQQLRSSGPPLVRDVQEAYTNTKNSLSRTASERGRDPGKFNFGVGTEGRGQRSGGPTGWGSSAFAVLDGKLVTIGGSVFRNVIKWRSSGKEGI